MPTKQWFQVEVGNDNVMHFLFSFISNLDLKALFVPVGANSGSVYSNTFHPFLDEPSNAIRIMPLLWDENHSALKVIWKIIWYIPSACNKRLDSTQSIRPIWSLNRRFNFCKLKNVRKLFLNAKELKWRPTVFAQFFI